MWAFQQFQKTHHPDEGTVKMVVEKAGFWDAWILLLFEYLRTGKTRSLTNWFYRKHSRIHWCYFACLHFLMGSHSFGSNNSRKAGRALTLALNQHPKRMAEPGTMCSIGILVGHGVLCLQLGVCCDTSCFETLASSGSFLRPLPLNKRITSDPRVRPFC